MYYYVGRESLNTSNLSVVGMKYMLFAGWEVRIVKNCGRGLENAAWGRRPRAAFSSPRSQFFTIRTDPKPVNNLFIFFQTLKRKKTHGKKTHASVTVTVVRDRKIRTVLRTNQIDLLESNHRAQAQKCWFTMYDVADF